MNLRRLWLGLISSLLLGQAGPAAAHEVPPSVVMIDIGGPALTMELQLQLSELGSALGLPLKEQPQSTITDYRARIADYIQHHLQVRSRDGRPFDAQIQSLSLRHTDNANWNSNDWLVATLRLSAPAGAATETFTIDYSVIIERVLSHSALVYVRRDIRNGLVGDRPMAVGTFEFGKNELAIDGSNGNWWRGFVHLFSLGMRHIAEGADHLLFLLALLLPAPLLARRHRWGESKSITASVRTIVTVVTGFTIGHSLSLAAAACGWLTVPTQLIEILIAVSILVSSLHAWRPVFAGREPWIASGFGLIHGLAFAETLSGLNFDATTLALSVLGFNLGIEAMQLLVIAVVLPPLILLGTTRYYHVVRNAGACFAAICATGWILERAFHLINPLTPVVDWLTSPPTWVVVAACLASTAAVIRLGSRSLARLTA